jgi:hypothetical protein
MEVIAPLHAIKLYPVTTSKLPRAITVQKPRGSPTLAAGLPLIKTERLPNTTGATWVTQKIPAGTKWGVDNDPR